MRKNGSIRCMTCGKAIVSLEEGVVSWTPLTVGYGSRGFAITHKNYVSADCDKTEDTYWMELRRAAGPHGLGTLVRFMTEPDADRVSLEAVIAALYYPRGVFSPLQASVDPKCNDPHWGKD